jgi:hypothetical protein
MPELVHADSRLWGDSTLPAPRSDEFFRPEEEHGASGEDDILPPLGGWYQTVEEPR